MKTQSKINGYENLLHKQYRVQKSLIFGLLTMLFCYLINAFSGDVLVGVFLTASIIYLAYDLIRSRVSKKKGFELAKLNCSLDDLLVVGLSAGLELKHCEDQKYILQSKLFGKTQVVIRSKGSGCEIIALEGLIACLTGGLEKKFNIGASKVKKNEL